jgi:hypothetical protein
MRHWIRVSRFIIYHHKGHILSENAAAELVRGERVPFDECSSPTESSVVSDSETEGESDDDDGEENDHISVRRRSSTALDKFALLNNLLGRSTAARDAEPSVAFAEPTTADTASIAGDFVETEIQQLRTAISDVLAHLFKLSMLIRRPIPQDRLVRSAKINMAHFEQFDYGYVQDCFPTARPWLQKRLAKAITRRRQHLVYNRKHHEKLAKPRTQPKPSTAGFPASGTIATLTLVPQDVNRPPIERHTVVPVSTRFASTKASEFVSPKNHDGDADQVDWEAGTQSSYAKTLSGTDVICFPPRPKDEDGEELTQFECPYCFRIQEIHSNRAWR